MGAGHDSAAQVLANRLRRRGATVEVGDFLTVPPWKQGQLLRAFYSAMIRWFPWGYDLAMRQWIVHPRFFDMVTRIGALSYPKPMLRRVEAFQPDIVVSTYNLAAQTLGRLRASDRLRLPVVSYVTDPGAHPYWVAPGADVHLAPLASLAPALERWGAGTVKVVAPMVREEFFASYDKAEARAAWQLPGDARIALINGGSWGVGATAATARLLAARGDVLPVVLCGRSRSLLRETQRLPGVRAVPWTDDIARLVAAADVVVDNAGGATCWEVLAAGRPVVVHRPIAGHGRLNAEALRSAGLARCVETDDDLLAAVAVAEPPAAAREVFGSPDAAEVVAGLW